MKTLIALSLLSFNYLWAWEVPFYSTLARTPDGLDLVQTLHWVAQTSSYLLCLFFLLGTANQLSKENYSSGGLAFIAAIIAGGAPYLAKSLI